MAGPDPSSRGGSRLSAVFAVPEFRAMWSAEVLSVGGDQLARVALAVVVFERSHSAALTGLGYALTFVPSFLGGALLGGIGDRCADSRLEEIDHQEAQTDRDQAGGDEPGE